VVAGDAQIVEVDATKQFGLAPKMLMTVFPLDARSAQRRSRSKEQAAAQPAKTHGDTFSRGIRVKATPKNSPAGFLVCCH
jgi:hypothetical protein